MMLDIFHCDATNEGDNYSYDYFIHDKELAKEVDSMSSAEVLSRLQLRADKSSELLHRPKVTLANWRFATQAELDYINARQRDHKHRQSVCKQAEKGKEGKDSTET